MAMCELLRSMAWTVAGIVGFVGFAALIIWADSTETMQQFDAWQRDAIPMWARIVLFFFALVFLVHGFRVDHKDSEQ